MTDLTLRDMSDAIATALGDHGEDYDFDALVDDLHTQYGIVPIDDIPADEFWETAARHHLPEQDETGSDANQFDTEVTAAITARRPLGEPAVWQRGGVTVHITGASRVNAAQRLVGASIRITSMTGASADLRGLATTADLWERVAPYLAEWEDTVRLQTEAVRSAERAATDARQAAETAARRLHAAEKALRALQPDAAPTGLMSKQEVAAYLGIEPGSVPRQMSRWGIVAVPERMPSGRTESRYEAAQVIARAAARPGRGARTDLRPDAASG